MAKVLVTGGVGMIGQAVSERLLANGNQVRLIDRRPLEALSDEVRATLGQVEYAACDINDIDGLRRQMAGCDLVVHMAALPSPTLGSAEEVFRVNAGGTFNVFQAAAEHGIRRVVQASSINALGLHYGVRNTDPLYLPVDEEHPPMGTDAYSFSKWIVEEIGEYFWRREGISSVALRFCGVIPHQRRQQWAGVQNRNQVIEGLLALSAPERRAWLENAMNEINTLRAQRMMENRDLHRRLYGPEAEISPERAWLVGSQSNLFTLVDSRDAAQAVYQGLVADYEGAHALFINDKDNTTGYASELLAELFFPNVTARKRQLAGTESLVSIEKARKLIGFEPQFGFNS